MKQIRNTYLKTGNIHHAYGLLGDREAIRQELFSFLTKDLKFPIIGNPDFLLSEFNVLKVDDCRILNEAQLSIPIKYDKKIFVIFTNSITLDAQNSMLKTLEEPRSNSYFFLVLPATIKLLPTLKSRLILGQLENIVNNINYLSDDFLDAKIGKRLDIAGKILKEVKEEKLTKSDVATFLKGLELSIKRGLDINKGKTLYSKRLSAISDIEKAIGYATDESPSLKVILEHLALVL